MRPDPRAEGARWLLQSERDLDAARYLREGGRHNLACYQAQQAAEKALKAVFYANGEETVLGHSAVVLVAAAGEIAPDLRTVADAARRLDRFYIPTRYPNGLPGGIPADAFDERDAAGAIADAEAVVATCRSALPTEDKRPPAA